MAFATRLFVGNLPIDTEEKDLHRAFSAFGEITNLDLKSKTDGSSDNKKFAFVSISASNTDVESCIKHFTIEDFNGNKLYVTRARESFLERLQRERQQALTNDNEKQKHEVLPKHNPIIKLGDKLNPRKRKIDQNQYNGVNQNKVNQNKGHGSSHSDTTNYLSGDAVSVNIPEGDKKKMDSEKKRLESMKKKRKEFKEKQTIIKTGLAGIDKVQNKKVIFSDNEDDSHTKKSNKTKLNNRNSLFDDDDNDNDDEVSFDVKKQFEGKQGQKVLDLQSRYKSDKRFNLDERFIDDDPEEGNDENSHINENGETEINQADEKAKQLSILQDVLGVTIKPKRVDQEGKKTKPKLGMLRFDPMQPDHAKFLAPIEEPKNESNKKSKKKAKVTSEGLKEEPPKQDLPTVEVSKEQFYKVSETLKETIAQPNAFSLRSLFGKTEDRDDDQQNHEAEYISVHTAKVKKVKNPLDPTEKNPFVYDSSDSETEEVKEEQEPKADVPVAEPKAVWKENLFFSMSDHRLKDGLTYFSKPPQMEAQKERRELKSLMKKRIYNKDRKNQMFQKKIGGRKKSMKKPYKSKG